MYDVLPDWVRIRPLVGDPLRQGRVGRVQTVRCVHPDGCPTHFYGEGTTVEDVETRAWVHLRAEHGFEVRP